MLEAPKGPRISKMEQTSLLTPRPEDPNHSYNTHYHGTDDSIGGGSKRTPLKTKILLTFFTLASLAALITLICVIALRDKKSSSEGPIGDVVPCTFAVPFRNWVNYGLENVTCPTTGDAQSCQYLADCLSIPDVCVPGSSRYLTCTQGVCAVITESTPDIGDNSGYQESGYCKRNATHGVCAMCVANECYGAALCAARKDCGNGKLQCFERGNFAGAV